MCDLNVVGGASGRNASLFLLPPRDADPESPFTAAIQPCESCLVHATIVTSYLNIVGGASRWTCVHTTLTMLKRLNDTFYVHLLCRFKDNKLIVFLLET